MGWRNEQWLGTANSPAPTMTRFLDALLLLLSTALPPVQALLRGSLPRLSPVSRLEPSAQCRPRGGYVEGPPSRTGAWAAAWASPSSPSTASPSAATSASPSSADPSSPVDPPTHPSAFRIHESRRRRRQGGGGVEGVGVVSTGAGVPGGVPGREHGRELRPRQRHRRPPQPLSSQSQPENVPHIPIVSTNYHPL